MYDEEVFENQSLSYKREHTKFSHKKRKTDRVNRHNRSR